MVVAWAQAQFDEGAGIGDGLVLPSVVSLEFPQGIFCDRIPRAARRTSQIMLSNQSLLDLPGALGINFLLTTSGS
jgi:hypothetical protein